MHVDREFNPTSSSLLLLLRALEREDESLHAYFILEGRHAAQNRAT